MNNEVKFSTLQNMAAMVRVLMARAMESWDAELTSSAIENSIRILEKETFWEIVSAIQQEYMCRDSGMGAVKPSDADLIISVTKNTKAAE